MSAICEQVARRRAAGEALEAGQATHMGSCARCAADESVRAEAQRALAGRPPAGGDAAFVARVTAGAEARLAARARLAWRWPAVAGVVVAAAALIVVLGGRASRREAPTAERPGALVGPSEVAVSRAPAPAPRPANDDAGLVAGLATLSDVEQGLARGARWDRIMAPIAAAGDFAPAARAPLKRSR